MSFLTDLRYRKISQSATVNDLLKEFFRKSIHICTAFVPLFALYHQTGTVVALAVVLVFYLIAEHLRIRGHYLPFISRVTAIAARRRDEGRFVLGPVTLALGVLATLILFEPAAARIGIFALAFGDGIASLAGKLFGQRKIPYTRGKTVEGSLACFTAVLVAVAFVTGSPAHALLIAVTAALIELIPLNDYDNLLIPVSISLVAVALGY